MPPTVALALSLMFSLVLLVREARRVPDVSAAVWLPCAWLFLLGSRSPSEWLGFNVSASADIIMEGSPTDRNVYAVLMALALIVLLKRRIRWSEVVRRNPWWTAFFVYCAISVLWSDFPDIAGKRWLKSLGDPLMALVLVSEARPAAAMVSVLKRCAFVLVPLSIVFIKYYPYLGRAYDSWSGLAFYTGVTTNKNMMGYLLFVFGLLFLCALLTRGIQDKWLRWNETMIAAVFFGMVAWLFVTVDSKTPLLGLGVALVPVMGSKLRVVQRHLGVVAVSCIAVAALSQYFFNVTESVLASAGRDATLTGRTEIWTSVLALATNPLMGSGFESFWLGERLRTLWQEFPIFKPVQAHNGYIETYLNLGWIGVVLFAAVLVSSYRAIRQRLSDVAQRQAPDVDELVLARFGVGFFTALLIYNVTEATFKPLNFLFVIFMALAVRYSASRAAVPAAVGAGFEGWRPLRSQPGQAAVPIARIPWHKPATSDATTASSSRGLHPRVNPDWTPRRQSVAKAEGR